MIEHYTKVVVDAFSAETGWDRLVGFPVEIEPLTRPFGSGPAICSREWSGGTASRCLRRGGDRVAE